MAGGAATGRFAPSPTGPLHAGSLVAALGSWLDARSHGGRWLVRIEDVDRPRCRPGMDAVILQQLATLGLAPDEAPVHQSQRTAAYGQTLEALRAAGWAYDLRLLAPRYRCRAGRTRHAACAPSAGGVPRHLPRRAARQAGAYGTTAHTAR